MSAIEPTAFLREFGREAQIRGFHQEILADTPAGPLMAFSRSGEGSPAYLSAGIHGDEPAGPLAALALLKVGAFDDGRPWAICPALNPTGLLAGTRDNAAGADLNRDYLLRHTPEAAAHAAWLESRPVPGLFISLHEDWESSGFYFYEINLGADLPERAARILGAVQPWFPPEPSGIIDDHEVRSPGWIHHAARADLPDHWPEAIFLAHLGCPLSFTLESPSSALLDHRVAAHQAAVLAILDSPNR